MAKDETILVDKEIKGPKTMKASIRALKQLCIYFLERAYGEKSQIFSKKIAQEKNESENHKEVVEKYGTTERGIETYSFIVYDSEGDQEVINRSVSIYGYPFNFMVQLKKSPEIPPYIRLHVEVPSALRESVRWLIEEFDSTFGELSMNLSERIDMLEHELDKKFRESEEQEVEEIAEELLTLDPKNATAYLYLGLLRKSHGRLDEARYNLELSLKRKKNDPRIMRELGIVLSRLGEHEKALELLKQSFSSRPYDAMLIAYLGRSYNECGLKDEAKKVLESIVENPNASVEFGESLEDALTMIKNELERAWLQ